VGGWIAPPPPTFPTDIPLTVQAVWDPNANFVFLRWQEKDILFEIIFSGADQVSPTYLSKTHLIEIAESME
jgi:hypothetical protein